jgi:HD superfamily phosphohydrolase
VSWRTNKAAPSVLLRNFLARLTSGKLDEHSTLEEEIDSLRRLQGNPLRELSNRFAETWKTKTIREPSTIHSADPVWGQVSIDEELSGLFGQPLIQRLNFIRQLSFAYLAFPSATHSRLSHTLGVSRLVDTAMSTIFRKDIIYTPNGSRRIGMTTTEARRLQLTAKAAAMIHDVGHAPFGHALDRFVGFLDVNNPHVYPDKYYSKLYLQNFLAEYVPADIGAERVAAIIGSDTTQLSGWDNFISELIDSALDLDRMDFLSRDAHMSGLAMGFNCVEALVERMCPFEADDCFYLAFEHPCDAYVEDLLSSREKMYVNCYEHPTKLAAERIFTRLVEFLVEQHKISVPDVILMSDDQILSLLAQATVGSRTQSALLQALLHNLPYDLVHEVDIDSDKAVVRAWNEIRDKPGMGKRAYVDDPTSWEVSLAEAAGIGKQESWQILVVVPERKVRRYVEVVEVLILKRTASGGYTAEPLSEVYPGIEEIVNGFRPQRRKFRIFANRQLPREKSNAIMAAAKDIFGA